MTIKVNLLPTERKRITFDTFLCFLVVVVLLCCVGFVMNSTNLSREIADQEREISAIEGEIKQIEQSLPVIDDLKSQISKLEDNIRVVESLKYDPVRYANLLTEVGKVLPSNVFINSLSVEPSTTSVTFAGVANKTVDANPLATIAALMAKIDESKILTDATLSSTSVTGDEKSGIGFTFSIEAHYNPDIAAGLPERVKASDDADQAEVAAPGMEGGRPGRPGRPGPGGEEAPAEEPAE